MQSSKIGTAGNDAPAEHDTVAQHDTIQKQSNFITHGTVAPWSTRHGAVLCPEMIEPRSIRYDADSYQI